MLKFTYLKDLEDIYPFNINGVDGGKESKQGNIGVGVTSVITYKTPFVVNGQLVTVYLDREEVVTCNTIVSWPFLQAIKASIMTKNNSLVSVILVYQFNMEMVVYKKSQGSTKHL